MTSSASCLLSTKKASTSLDTLYDPKSLNEYWVDGHEWAKVGV